MSIRLVGAILSGGEARRLNGQRKGLFTDRAGHTIIQSLHRAMLGAGLGEVFLLANEREVYGACDLTILQDLRKGAGPLGGIEAVLAHIEEGDLADGVLLAPCDMPLLTAVDFKKLIASFSEGVARVVAACVNDLEHPYHPLCCVVHRDVLADLKRALDSGHLKVGHLWRALGAVEVCFEDARAFQNINTVAEYERWRDGWQR